MQLTGYLDYQISIHALLAESDLQSTPIQQGLSDFYPRSPCGERPASQGAANWHKMNFYPRSPCGERRQRHWLDSTHRRISIHALLAESDVVKKAVTFNPPEFLSTLSLRRATALIRYLINTYHNFYPRSPCGERPLEGGSESGTRSNFYPRSPCGERPVTAIDTVSAFRFLSTLSLRRATFQTPNLARYSVLFLSTLSLRRATAKVHKTVGYFCAYETNFMEIASSC